MRKRIIAALLALLMVFLLLPATALAAGDVTVSVNGGAAQNEASLEAAINASGVALANITSIEIMGGEVEDEDWDYIESNNNALTLLTTLTVTDGVSAAANLPNDFIFNNRKIAQVNIAKVTSIGARAFVNCASLATASFPAATSIGAQAFVNCESLATASFPAATSMDARAFGGCTSLTAASFPAATSISTFAFSGCTKLTTASFPAATSIGGYAFDRCSALTTASFPAATSIGEYAFYNCVKLASLSLPAAPPTVTDANAFYGCPTVRSLTLVGASGVALTGQTLNNAIDAYEADSSYSGGKWYGWTLPARAAVAPAITTQPTSQTVTEGSTATFTVVASGTPAPTYQWQSRTSAAGTWSNITGAASASYTTPATTTAMSGWQYRCVVSTGVSPNATSNAATLAVTARPRITITPAATFAQGSAPGNLRVTVGAGTTITINDLVSATMDGVPLTNGNEFTGSTGSIIMDFRQSYLNTLAPGSHTLRVTITGGAYAEAHIIVTIPGGTDGDADVPKTGDGSMPGLWAGLALLAGCELIALRKRRNRGGV